ncbi:bifunctional oligoribonuclease/PAP phosphatase NrnA [Peribacillus cavernae]|uniref:Bifunctional oligoribonuclease/PAP phosphatase NrnA n=1 Tax=Peribacillus cavernae TaxID=1674310 RepID=A0A433HAW8_9BACI|nr:bifunctional oligoribonuclease/PAP phosphatase NrnA [Peribacillus cavernae]MDQ0220071.1 phosphoesterase RecJ-like protein [Peribacillus cavernae]RUQ25438.1 bifunctional oligoribonuclease/PAP phosphatase NrnA [Peribacillus cavernae]
MKAEILKEIERYETIIIHRHVRPDPDAYGSQCGLGEILKTSFPEKNIYLAGKQEESLNYLKRLDTISDDTYKGALVIVCDTANTARICDRRYTQGDKLIKIDHHPNEDPYGDLLWVDEDASSTSEMIYEFYLSGKDKGLKMSDEAARLLFAGIVGDTGRFLFASTTEKTFSYAGELIQYDFSRPELFNGMYDVDENITRLNGYVLQNFEILECGIGKMVITKDIMRKFNTTPAEASLLVSALGSVKGVKAWAFFIEEEKEIRVRLRSKGPVINGVARKYNGGGHPLAAGASIYSWDRVDEVLKDLEDVCR